MVEIGYHASHEQFAPGDLLGYAQRAQSAGFTSAMCSDHLFPWLSTHTGAVGYAFAWLGAALQATDLGFGVVCAPGQRYHPVVVAQAAVTLTGMFPERFWIAVGSGEAANEHVTGDPWPDKQTRRARLRECVDIMRALWRGETVDHSGLVRVRGGRVYVGDAAPPPVFAAAVSAESARWAGAWADGMITVNQPLDRLRSVVDAFRDGGGEGKPVRLQYHLSWAPSEADAEAQALDQWRHGALPADELWNLETPEEFDAASKDIGIDELRAAIVIGADLDRHAAHLVDVARLGFDRVMLHNVGSNQRQFIDTFGDKVLPGLR